MNSFHEISFPLSLAFGASGGPVRQTEIVTLANGCEHRNTSQLGSRRRYDAGVGVRSVEDMQTLLAFFEARFGQLYGFRFLDPFDHEADTAGEFLGTGDGHTKLFRLQKSYGDQEGHYARIISKPIAETVEIYIDGQRENTLSLDATTGWITLGTAPSTGAIITARFNFEVPVRFDTPNLSARLEDFGAGSALSVPLIEILPHA